MTRLGKIAANLAMVLFLADSAVGQAPPRFYWKTLTGANAFPVIYQSLSGNANPIDPAYTVLPEARFEATVVTVGYARTFALFDRAATIAVLLPMGRLSGEASLAGRTTAMEASGFGDPLVELGINLVGAKAIRNIPDLMRYEPGFSMDVLFDLAFPVGEYNKDQPLNLGQNRWYGRIGAPIIGQLGPWVPGRRTTVELLPAVWFFSDNDEFVGEQLSTKPIFQLEGHLTHDFAKDLWGSFDTTWATGGAASLDGIEGDKINNLLVGLTLGYTINENVQLTLGYMATVNDNEPTDLRLDGFKFSLLFGWHPLIEGMKRLGGSP